MKRYLLFIKILLFLFSLSYEAGAKTEQTVVNGATTKPINFSGTGYTYNWINNTPGTGLPASGIGNISSFVVINNGNGPATAVAFTITVNSGLTPVITTSTITGSIIGCVGSPSASPNVAQFTVAGTSLTDDITVTPPPGFDISLTATGGYSPSLVLKQAGGAVISTTIYVRSSAPDPVGPISGNIQINTPGATPGAVPVTGVVNVPASINQVQNVIYNNGATTAPINFTGIGNTFTWTNNNPPIGLPASGVGNIVSFTAINNGNAPAIAAVTVTPSYAPIAYIANNFSDNVTLINTATIETVTPATINVGKRPWGVALSPDYTKVYVTNNVSGTVSVINTSSNTVTATVTVGSSPEGVLVSRDGNSVYVANEMSGTVSVINTSSNLVTSTIQVGNSPTMMVASPDGKTIYVSNYEPQGTISVINTASNTVAATIGSLNFPTGLAISPDGSKLYVASNTQNTVTVINTANYSVITTIPAGAVCTGLAISPDGSRLYVTNSGSATVSVINTATNTVSATIGVGTIPSGICVSPDGSFICVACAGSNLTILINSSTNAVVATSSGNFPFSFGNFLMPATSCSGTPTTFTITVNPSPPSITANTASGTISACAGTPSASPNIEQFTVSGNALTGDLTAAAPPAGGFEVSFSPGSGYGSSLAIPEVAGTVNKVIVYVRSSASATGSTSGNTISGDITLSSPGAADQKVAVTGTVYAGPTMNQVASQPVAAGQATAPVNFIGNADFYTWTNDMPGIGLAASGTVNIPSFTAVNQGPNPIVATITVTPQSMSAAGCAGTPVTFTITVSPPPPPVVTSSGTLTGLSTIYGTASSSESFTVSATNATAGILVTPPQGFEVSTDNITFNATVVVGSAGTITNAAVYIRLAAATPVSDYAGNIALSEPGAADLNVNMPLSTVDRTILTITAPDVTRAYGVSNPVFIPQYSGFVNGDNESSLLSLPDLTTIATITSPVGKYTIHVSGGFSLNYLMNPVDGTLTVVPSPGEIVVPNAFSPNGDGINDLWNINALADFPQCLVSVYSRNGSLVFQSKGYARPWDGTYSGSPVPTGTYYYIINFQGGLQQLSGYVAVLR
jgi:gliding motility-associated-like protein